MPKTLYERDMEDSLRQIAVALGVDVSGTPDVEDVIRAAIKTGKDAERYRWLKTRKRLDLRSGHGEWQRMDGTKFTASHYLAEGYTQHAPAESLDETIDAAMLVRRIGAA